MTITELKRRAWEIRIETIKALAAARSGHTAGPLGQAEILSALYFRFLEQRALEPRWTDRDRCVLSCGHTAPGLYAALALAGYFPVSELATLRKFGSRLQGHTHNLSTPGVEVTGGPLGQGISQAVGMAIGLKIDHRPQRVWCLTSDGEHDEGQTWEAIMLGAKWKLDHLVVIVDRNHIQISGSTEEVLPLGKLEEKYRAFGWHALRIDGNDMQEVVEAFEEAEGVEGQPTAIVAYTVPGKGVRFMENRYEWHGKPPTEEEAEVALVELTRHLKAVR